MMLFALTFVMCLQGQPCEHQRVVFRGTPNVCQEHAMDIVQAFRQATGASGQMIALDCRPVEPRP